MKAVLIVVVLLCSTIKITAQTYGCHVEAGSSDRLYYTPYGMGSPSEWQTIVSGSVNTSGETGGFRTDGTISYGCIADIGGTCTVYQQYDTGGGVIGMRVYKTGYYASISPLNCAIEDWLPLMVVIMAILGYFKLNETCLSNEI